MSANKIVVIGGVASGTSAAAKARRCDEDAEITIFERGEYISYATCSLPYYISGLISHKNRLVLNTPKTFKKQHNIEVKLRHEVTRIIPERKEVEVRNLNSNREQIYPYDKLVIATGASPIVPPIDGIELSHIYTLRTIEDAENIRNFIEEENSRRAAIVGGGLIGLEMVEAFLERGLYVTVVEKMAQLLPNFDWEMAQVVENHLLEKGVDVICCDAVKSFKGDGMKVKKLITESGREIDVDIVLMSVGIRPNVKLAREAGITLGPTRAIATNSRMETSVDDIYAAGDCAESKHIITGEPTWAPLGSVANKHGRVAGENVMGRDAEFKGVLGSCIAKVCDLAVALTGLGEKGSREKGYDIAVSYVYPEDHAGSYPGAAPVTIKTIADKKDGRLLGAQIVGSQGVDKRIDVIATAIYGGIKADELLQVDLAYAPPFSPAKDPVIVAGLVTGNEVKGDVSVILPAQLKKRLDDGEDFTLLDVRTLREFESGYIEGAKHIHVEELRDRLDELERGKDIVVYCLTGFRSYRASRILMNRGFNRVLNLSGGTKSWNYGMEKPEKP